MSAITSVRAREILDSRGTPTVEVDVTTEAGGHGRGAVPSGASTGKFEALELRDGGDRFAGKGVRRAVANVNEILAPAVLGREALDQRALDDVLIDEDGTPTKSRLGANAVLGVSLAVARAASDEIGLPLFRYLGGADAHLLPVPLMNVLNGGAHAENNIDVQEFMIVPHGAPSFSESLRMGVEVVYALRKLLTERALPVAVGDEGGFAPNLNENEQGLALLVEAIERAGYEPGAEVGLGLDVAASELYYGGSYVLKLDDQRLTSDGLIELYGRWLDRYPILTIEDPFDQEDWEGWKAATGALGGRVQLVGDDLFVTNTERLSLGVERGAANAVLVKVNQIGTLTEAGQAVRLASRSGYASVISHRSGET
ncbi:MAG: phosphopyruvate hydratase, partial [Actinomycetota bacterium]